MGLAPFSISFLLLSHKVGLSPWILESILFLLHSFSTLFLPIGFLWSLTFSSTSIISAFSGQPWPSRATAAKWPIGLFIILREGIQLTYFYIPVHYTIVGDWPTYGLADLGSRTHSESNQLYLVVVVEVGWGQNLGHIIKNSPGTAVW